MLFLNAGTISFHYLCIKLLARSTFLVQSRFIEKLTCLFLSAYPFALKWSCVVMDYFSFTMHFILMPLPFIYSPICKFYFSLTFPHTHDSLSWIHILVRINQYTKPIFLPFQKRPWITWPIFHKQFSLSMWLKLFSLTIVFISIWIFN